VKSRKPADSSLLIVAEDPSSSRLFRFLAKSWYMASENMNGLTVLLYARVWRIYMHAHWRTVALLVSI